MFTGFFELVICPTKKEREREREREREQKAVLAKFVEPFSFHALIPLHSVPSTDDLPFPFLLLSFCLFPFPVSIVCFLSCFLPLFVSCSLFLFLSTFLCFLSSFPFLFPFPSLLLCS